MRTSASLIAVCALATAFTMPARAQEASPKPWFLYLRDGGKSPLYAFASYSFGLPVIMAGTVVDTPNDYSEVLAGAGVNLFGSSGNGASVFALGSKATDSWYLEVYGLPNLTVGRVSLTAFAGLYVPLEGPGVGQYFVDPVTVLVRAHPKVALGGSYTGYKIAGLPARLGAGPAAQVTIPGGSVTLDALAGIENFVKELRVTLQFAL